jgi:electron transfer flavoprotein beta subunit
MSNNNLSVISLVSIGEHPTSRRPRRAEQDARAIELGLKLVGDNLQTLHAGELPDDPGQQTALRSYLGMGLAEIHLLEMPENADAVLVIAEYLKQQKIDIILTGVCAESGESSGMLPYLLAEQLGMAMVTSIAEILSIDEVNKQAEVLQALPRGQRRKLKINLPFIASVDMAAALPRQSAFGPAMRGQFEAILASSFTDEESSCWQKADAKKRPKRLKIIKAKTAADRFKAATAKASGSGGKVVYGVEESAQAILDLLVEEGLV